MGRIPIELQAIFLASNRGEEVHTPPSNRSAFKVFKNMLGIGRKRGSPRIGKLYDLQSVGSISTLGTREFDISYAYADTEKTNSTGISGPVSAHEHLELLLTARGYRTERHPVLESSLFNRPTPLQLASYDKKMLELMKKKQNESKLREILSAGVSPNACNIHGETLMHKVCRDGHHRLMNAFVREGAILNIADDQGRTLLHDTCWGKKPSFEIFEMLAKHELSLLFMTDCRGACPLEYVRKEDYPVWIDFLSKLAEKLWPPMTKLPPLPRHVKEPPHSRPVPDPKNRLPLDLVSMLASGRVSLSEFNMLLEESSHSNGEFTLDTEESVSSDEADDDEEDESETYDEFITTDPCLSSYAIRFY